MPPFSAVAGGIKSRVGSIWLAAENVCVANRPAAYRHMSALCVADIALHSSKSRNIRLKWPAASLNRKKHNSPVVGILLEGRRYVIGSAHIKLVLSENVKLGAPMRIDESVMSAGPMARRGGGGRASSNLGDGDHQQARRYHCVRENDTQY